MRLTIFTAGSRGDIQPGLLLGRALQRAGFQVTLAAPHNFAAWVQARGLDFHPLRGDVQQIMSGDTGRSFMQGGSANPLRAIRLMRQMIGPIALQMAEDALAACEDARALLSLAVFAPFGATIAELKNIPLINLEPTPLLPTGDFPAPGWPLQRDLGGLHNRLSGVLMLWVIWQWYGPFLNQFRQRHGLQPYRAADFQRLLRSHPLLGAYSPSVLPPPPDWPDQAHVTGYWFDPDAGHWQPPPELLAFLERGEPPVYVGFGSMAGQDPQELARLTLQALAESGRRGLLLTGWGGLDIGTVPDDVLVLDSAPHAWLFPRLAAVVHHGGAGTTAEGLRAGAPTVIVPFIVDQPFWGRRIAELGLGPPPIPAKKLTAERLAGAIRTATSDPGIQARAAALAKSIRAEDGLATAVHLVQRYLGDQS